MDLSSLQHAFWPGKLPRLAIVGAGGKTSLLFRLARLYGTALLSNSAHLSVEQTGLADRCFTVTRPEDVPGEIPPGISLLTGPAEARGRTLGLDADCLEQVLALAERQNLPLLIEADGSRGLPLKAPSPWEPPIPAWVDEVIVVAGLSGLGLPLDPGSVYRPEDFANLAGLALGEPVTVEALARVLLHSEGGQKHISAGAKRLVLLNQADDSVVREQAFELARLLLPGFDGVALASLHGPGPGGPASVIHAVCRPTASILLAAGESRRMGQPKQLLEWQGEALVRRAAKTALLGGLDPVIVVTGAHTAQVEGALSGLPVQTVYNPAWPDGLSASLRAGLNVLPERTGAAVFLLVDQPFVSPDLIQAVTRRAAETLAPVVAPRVEGRRANPVLFDRATFPGLLALQGDAGGRQILERYPVEYVDWPDGQILRDVDTPEDFSDLQPPSLRTSPHSRGKHKGNEKGGKLE